jgi:hypothetical protein
MEGQMNNSTNYDLALGFLQVFDVLLNVSQVSNDVILKELQKQNALYLETIIAQNKKILELLNNINLNDIHEIVISLEKD